MSSYSQIIFENFLKYNFMHPELPNAFREEVCRQVKGRTPAMHLFGDVYPTGINELSRRHRRILQEEGFSAAHKFYSWKHTGAIMAALAGVSLKELQIQLRHHSLDETDGYLRQLGYTDLLQLEEKFPEM